MRLSAVSIAAVLAICAVVSLPSTASASNTTFASQTFGPETVASAQHIVATLPKFDPNMGLLVGVQLELSVSMAGGGVTFDNEGVMGGSVRLGYGGTVEITTMDLTLSLDMPLQYSDGFVGADDEGAADFLGSDAFYFGAGSMSDNTSMFRGLNDDRSAFVGPGSFDVLLDSSVRTYLETTGPYGPISIDPGSVTGEVTVRYEYSVPEPASLMLLCLGGGILLRRRS